LIRAVNMVDAALSTHGLPPFYADPCPHVSLMWAPGDVQRQLEALVSELAPAPAPELRQSRQGEGDDNGHGGVSSGSGGSRSRDISAGKALAWTAAVRRVVCRVSGHPEFTVWGRHEGGLAPPPL
jgi:hypothetical protein